MLLEAHQVEEEKPPKFEGTLIPVNMCCRQKLVEAMRKLNRLQTE
jgi:hypothetical protein